MLYWVGVYALIVLIVATPFVVLYMVVALLWLVTKALQMILRLITVAATRTGVSRQGWHTIHRWIVSH